MITELFVTVMNVRSYTHAYISQVVSFPCHYSCNYS